LTVDDGEAQETQACDLCGLPVGRQPWMLSTGERSYVFCCEGCLGIFQMLHDLEAETVTQPSPR